VTGMTDTDCCQRCKLPLAVTRFHFQVEAEPPIPGAVPVAIVLCASCLESMQRWMERAPRPVEARLDKAGIESPDELPVKARSRRRSKKRRSRDSARPEWTLDRKNASMHPAALLGIAALVVICATALVVLAANFVSDLMQVPTS
jgi:hypothetical protein